MNQTARASLPQPDTALQARQITTLRRYLQSVVVPFSPYYRERFAREGFDPASLRTWGDLRRMPFTSKEDLVATPENPKRSRDFMLVPDRAVLARRPSTIARAVLAGRAAVTEKFEREFRPLLMTATTGRSADPVPFLFTAHDIGNLETAGYRIMRVCGAERDFKMINLFPYAPHLAFWTAHYAGTAFGVFMLGTGGGKVMGTEGNVRAIGKISPEVLIGIPTFLYHVLQEAVEEGVRCPGLKKIVLGGEKAPAGMRRKLRSLARSLGAGEVDVLMTYAFTEAKMAWAECPHPPDQPSHGYHLYPDLNLVEIVDPRTGEPVGPGEPGEIVHTPLSARGTVVLRYRTGDCVDGGLVYERCPGCGRRVPRLVGSISRTSEIKEMQLDKVKGTLIDFNVLEHVLDDSDHVGAWQLELRKHNDDPLDLDELILHVHKEGGVDDEKLGEELREKFAARTEMHPNRILFHSRQEMRKLQGVGTQIKEQRIVDHRPRPGSAAADPQMGTSKGTIE